MHGNHSSFVILESVDSTNNYAMRQLNSGVAKHGDCWYAIEQTTGKGRRGKHWAAQEGKNITLSIVINPHFLRMHEQFRLSAAISLACYDLLKIYDSINTKIKWPNDLFWNDRKAGGILIENVIKGKIWQWSVIGVGININQTDFDLTINHPVSLKEIGGREFDPIQQGRELYAHVMNRVNELKAGDFKKMLVEYNAVLFKKNEKVRLKKQNMIFETTITGVSEQGQLQTFDTMEHSLNFDEIEWLL